MRITLQRGGETAGNASPMKEKPRRCLKTARGLLQQGPRPPAGHDISKCMHQKAEPGGQREQSREESPARHPHPSTTPQAGEGEARSIEACWLDRPTFPIGTTLKNSTFFELPTPFNSRIATQAAVHMDTVPSGPEAVAHKRTYTRLNQSTSSSWHRRSLQCRHPLLLTQSCRSNMPCSFLLPVAMSVT